MSVRSAALAEMRTRVKTITKANGFNTDAGKKVFLGEAPVLGPDDPDAVIALVVGADSAGYQGEHASVSLPVDVQVNVKATDLEDPWPTVEAAVEDVKRAIETDHDLGGKLLRRGLERGSSRPFDREAGSVFVGVAVEYTLRFVELWGAP